MIPNISLVRPRPREYEPMTGEKARQLFSGLSFGQPRAEVSSCYYIFGFSLLRGGYESRVVTIQQMIEEMQQLPETTGQYSQNRGPRGTTHKFRLDSWVPLLLLKERREFRVTVP